MSSFLRAALTPQQRLHEGPTRQAQGRAREVWQEGRAQGTVLSASPSQMFATRPDATVGELQDCRADVGQGVSVSRCRCDDIMHPLTLSPENPVS